MPKVKRVRDITDAFHRAEVLEVQLKQITSGAEDGQYNPALNAAALENVASITATLKTLDARSGRREKGKGPALTTVSAGARKTARKSR